MFVSLVTRLKGLGGQDVKRVFQEVVVIRRGGARTFIFIWGYLLSQRCQFFRRTHFDPDFVLMPSTDHAVSCAWQTPVLLQSAQTCIFSERFEFGQEHLTSRCLPCALCLLQ